MLLKLDEPKLLSDAVSIISELVTEVRAKVNKQGLSIIAIDPANVALVMLRLPSTSFAQFKFEKEDVDEELGLNLEDLKAILRRCSPGSSLILEKDGNLLKLEIQDKVKRAFSLALIDVDSEEKQMPQLEFASKVEIDSIHLSEAVEDASIVADACSLITTQKDQKFIVEAKGSLHSSRTEFSSDEAKITAGDSRAKYSLEYLRKFVRGSKLSDKVMLQFSKDYPCRFDYKNAKIELAFILAPRVETEDS